MIFLNKIIMLYYKQKNIIHLIFGIINSFPKIVIHLKSLLIETNMEEELNFLYKIKLVPDWNKFCISKII